MEYSEKYINELKESSDFKRLLELKKIIDDKYMKEINNFKRCEELYFESKSNKYYPDKDGIRNKYLEAKTILYNKVEVKEYLDIQAKLDVFYGKVKVTFSKKNNEEVEQIQEATNGPEESPDESEELETLEDLESEDVEDVKEEE